MRERHSHIPWVVGLLWIIAATRQFLMPLDRTFLNRGFAAAIFVLGVAVGFYFFLHGFAALRRKRLILNTPTSRVRGAALGLVEVCGTAVGPYTLMAPLSAVDCFYYRATACESAIGDMPVTTVLEEQLSVPFFLEDETGRLMVDPRGAEIALSVRDDELTTEGAAGYVQEFLLRHGVYQTAGLRLEECCIHPGDKLYVLGTLCERSSLESSFAKSKNAERPLCVLSEAAADLQRRSILDSIGAPISERYRPRITTADFDCEPPVVLGKISRRPFFISSRSQKDLVARLDWTAILCIWGGPALSLASAAILLTLLGRW